MASITKTTTMNGGTRYRVRWRVDSRTVERWTPTLAAARALKTQAESDALTGIPLDPQSGARLLNDYFTDWVASRLGRGRPLSPTTRIGYERLWRRTVEAGLGRNQLRALRPESIRAWHADVTIRAGSDQAAKAYRLVRAVLATAEADEFIRINPCRIRGGGQEHHQERPMVDTSLVLRLAETIEPRYRALVLVAGFAGLRTGESLGLRRCDVDLLHGELRVIAHAQEVAGHGRMLLEPKSEAGRRVVAIPSIVVEALDSHLATFTVIDASAWVFTGPSGTPLRRATFSKAWRRAVAATGGPSGLRAHDLRTPRGHAHSKDAWRNHQGAHGQNRTRLVSGGTHLPARNRRTRSRHRVLPGSGSGRHKAAMACTDRGVAHTRLRGWCGVGAEWSFASTGRNRL